MEAKLRWGILGTGSIAAKLAEAIGQSQTGRLVAVGSRSSVTAAAFGAKFGVERCYHSYEGLVNDGNVDAVYIALPNHLHAPWATRCAQAGKHILCEKPIGLNCRQAQAIIDAAQQHDVFLMEAFMYRTHPQTARLVELIREGAVGQVRVIESTFGFDRGLTLDDIRMHNAMGGGSIMDVGCYTMSGARLVAGAALGVDVDEPLEIRGVAHIGAQSHVDEYAAAALRFDGDIVAHLACGIKVQIRPMLNVWGSDGQIMIDWPWQPGSNEHRFVLRRNSRDAVEEFRPATDASVYSIEVDTVARHVRDRQAPPPCMTWKDTLGNMAAMDRWRESIGLAFEGE